MSDNRADSFLRLIRRSHRGRLKIYLGYAAGVGKTYQMLLEARRLKEDGIDVVLGLVETHGRAETEVLMEGLEMIPPKRITYRGIEIEEMDLEAILFRRPVVVIIDELAHTNVPGSKNGKRYQDIEEILTTGIHVISTLNVQHLESLYGTVERATGIRVRERVPDRIVAEADQLVNVDITTEDLRRRLKEGKVYTRERIEVALNHFFKPTNLEQLRELTLRELAAQIDSRWRDPLAEETPSSPDQVMVCLSSRGPNNEALLRYASRLAGRLNRNWYAVYVQTHLERPTIMDAPTQRILSNTLMLAQQLGATVFTYRGDDIVKTILHFAKEYRVGHIVIGAPGKKLSFWRRLRGEVSMVERLIAESPGITVVVIDTKEIYREIRSDPEAPPAEKVWEKGRVETSVSIKQGSIWDDISVILWKEAIEKENAMKQLLDILCQGTSDLRAIAWLALLEREKQGGTFVGEDVAIPHARIEGLVQPLVAVGVGHAGIYDREVNRSAKIMILFLSVTEKPENHVALLGIISRMARDDQWRKEILAAANLPDVVQIISKWAGGDIKR